MIVATLALAGIFVALYLLLYKMGVVGNLSCSIGSCETVNTSRWAVFMGAPVAGWGVAFYVVLFSLALVSLEGRYADSLGMSKLLALVSGGGVVFSAWLRLRARPARLFSAARAARPTANGSEPGGRSGSVRRF